MQRQKDQYQGLWIVSPDGMVLSGHHDVKRHETWAQEVLEALAAGLSRFGPVSQRTVTAADALPYRGRGQQSDGTLTLAVYTRAMHKGKPDGPPVLDSLALTPEEWASFVPAKENGGTEWSIPDKVARRFCRFLSPASDQSTLARPEEVTEVSLTAHLTKSDDGMVVIRYRGNIAARHEYEGKSSLSHAELNGTALWDAKTGQLQSILLVAVGTYRAPPPYDQPRDVAAVAEWTATRAR